MKLTHCDVCRKEIPEQKWEDGFYKVTYEGAGGLYVRLSIDKQTKDGFRAADVCQACKINIAGQMIDAGSPL